MNRTLTAVAGVRAGHWTHHSGTTGVTAVLFPEGARGGVAIPGHASGTRELGALAPTHIAGDVHGFCLSGGSAFGLAAADGVMAVLAERGIGFESGAGPVPIVPAAILFDLGVAAVRPGAEEGRLAALAALDEEGPVAEGPFGAGAGARVAKVTGSPLPGGFGSWSEEVGDWTVAAGVAVNAVGIVREPDSGEWLAGVPVQGEDLGVPPGDWRGAQLEEDHNTTLAVVVTDAPLDRAQCNVVAAMAVAGLARTLYPAFTPFDGDTVFVGATGKGLRPDTVTLARLGHGAASFLARAVVRAVRQSSRRSE